MIKVGDKVRVNLPGSVFHGQEVRVDRMEASSKSFKVWYRLMTTTDKGLSAPGWFEAHEIEELPQEEKP